MPKAKKVSPQVLKKIRESGVEIPQIADLVHNFMTIAGGPKALAKMMMEEYIRTQPGSLMRQRILDSILRLLTTANQAFVADSQSDLLTNDDIERELIELVKEIPDGQETKASGSG